MEEDKMEPDRKKGHFTFRTTAVLLMISAAFELLSLTAEEPLFGEIRSGIGVGIYHFAYAVLFTALGVGLWRARKWGYTLVFVTAALYTFDKLQFILGRHAMENFIAQQMSGYEETLRSQGVDSALIMQAIMLTSIIIVLCWWGFALYTYWRRDYFKNTGT
jgi:multisubunit Na+/H+ antiporter MnhC subunit